MKSVLMIFFLFRYDLGAATELLLNQTDISTDNDESDHEDESNDQNKTVTGRTSLFSRNGSFISFRKFRQQRFQPNTRVRKRKFICDILYFRGF
jgi:hypothetical protein